MTPKFFNKKISTPIGIAVVLLCAGLVGILAWQYFGALKEEVKTPEVEVPEKKISLDVNKYLHKDAVLYGVAMPPEAEYHAISVEEAILFVVQHLENKGVKDIKIYHILWSVAPVGQFYIAGECSFNREDKHYSKFLASILDNSGGEIGEPKLLFKGKNIWYSDPEPEIIYEPDPILPKCEQFDAEFLGNYEAMAEFYKVFPVFRVREGEDETANWKSYRNEEYGFDMKYPEKWEDYYLAEKNKISWKIPDKTIDFFHTISIEVYKRDYFSTKDWLKELNTSIVEEGYPPNYKIDREVIIGEIIGLEVSQESEGGLYTKVGIIKNNFVYEFTKVKANWEKNEEIDREFYQMLSTFGFLE